MEETHERHRISWTTRINIRPASRELLRTLAEEERISIATMIGLAVEAYVTARSTS